MKGMHHLNMKVAALGNPQPTGKKRRERDVVKELRIERFLRMDSRGRFSLKEEDRLVLDAKDGQIFRVILEPVMPEQFLAKKSSAKDLKE